MAFPIPSHLPRKGNPQDVSSKILSKLDEATKQSLDSKLASSWLAELDETIESTKERIHERIHADLPYFERQLASSKSIQTRLQSLTSNIDTLSDSLSNSESGLIPSLVRALTAHAALARDSVDASTTHGTLAHLLRCRTEFDTLRSLTQQGKLADTVATCAKLEVLLDEAPSPLCQAQIMLDLKRKYRAAKDSTEERLSNAYSRSIVVSPSELIIRPSVQIQPLPHSSLVGEAETILALPAILSSLSANSLSSHLTTLRRNLTTHYIDYILKQPASITITQEKSSLGELEHKLCQFPSPPNTENRMSRLENLSVLFSFLDTYFFPTLPSSQKEAFTRSLCKPTTAALLQNLIIPSLPSSLNLLPSFLALVNAGVLFEEQFIVGVLDNTDSDREVKAWADGVSGHYERKRRLEILDSARAIIIAREYENRTFRAEVLVTVEKEIDAIAIQPDSANDRVGGMGWGFDEEEETEEKELAGTEENGWSFDDDINAEPEPEPEPEVDSGQSHDPGPVEESEEDPADAWGWNDEDDPSPVVDDNAEQSAWDDPWGGDPEPSTVSNGTHPPTVSSTTSPKPAKRLEKFTMKRKNSSVSSSVSVPPSTNIAPTHSRLTEKKPADLALQPVPIETYLVSERTRTLVQLANDSLRESKEYISSKLFSSASSSSSSEPGSILLQSALSVLDLYRALYPVTFSPDLASSPAVSMRFSNDCLYLSEEITRIEKATSGLVSLKDRVDECRERLRVLGECWFEDTIDKQRQTVEDILMDAEGFTETTDQERFDECESIVSRVLRVIRAVAHDWKNVLSKSKYYTAIGSIVDAALSRILSDILALPDIPEVESHRLSELCKILNALEGLFVEPTSQDSFVVAYVPSWLKYSYLSELLEASIADLSYLFGEGALVDFDVEELAKLVRALFADTPLRTRTIEKLLAGHPERS